MSYRFNLESIKKNKRELERYFKDVPRGKQPRDLWKDTISLVPNSGYRNKIFSRNGGIVNLRDTVEEAYYSLMKYAEKNKHLDVRDRFMTEDEIMHWAMWLKNEFEQYLHHKSYPLNTYFEFILGYYVMAAFRGFSAEYEFSDWLNSKLKGSVCFSDDNITEDICGFFGCKNHDELDRKFMVDLLVVNNEDINTNEFSGGDVIQIKNRSFLLGGGYESFDKDLKGLKEAATTLKEKHNTDYYFAFYDTDGGWLKKKEGRFLFNSNEVFELFDKYDKRGRREIFDKKINNGEYIITDLK